MTDEYKIVLMMVYLGGIGSSTIPGPVGELYAVKLILVLVFSIGSYLTYLFTSTVIGICSLCLIFSL